MKEPRRRRRRRWLFSRAPRRDDDYIWYYQFPQHVEDRCRQNHPELNDHDWKLCEQGLREWFLCCSWRDGEVLGMPSKLVDEAWHEFILDSRHYTEFCERAFGEYLHHTPESSMNTPMSGALDATNRAFERSPLDSGTAVLWGLDSLIGHGPHDGAADGGHHHHESGAEAGSSFESGEANAGESGGGDTGGDSGGSDAGGDSGSSCGGGDSGGSSCGSSCGGGGGD